MRSIGKRPVVFHGGNSRDPSTWTWGVAERVVYQKADGTYCARSGYMREAVLEPDGDFHVQCKWTEIRSVQGADIHALIAARRHILD